MNAYSIRGSEEPAFPKPANSNFKEAADSLDYSRREAGLGDFIREKITDAVDITRDAVESARQRAEDRKEERDAEKGIKSETWQEAQDRIGIPRYSLSEFKEAGWWIELTLKNGKKVKGQLGAINSYNITLRVPAVIDGQLTQGSLSYAPSEIKKKDGKYLISKTRGIKQKEVDRALADQDQDERRDDREERGKKKKRKRENNPGKLRRAGKRFMDWVHKEEIEAEAAERAAQLAEDKAAVQALIPVLAKAINGVVVSNDNGKTESEERKAA